LEISSLSVGHNIAVLVVLGSLLQFCLQAEEASSWYSSALRRKLAT